MFPHWPLPILATPLRLSSLFGQNRERQSNSGRWVPCLSLLRCKSSDYMHTNTHTHTHTHVCARLQQAYKHRAWILLSVIYQYILRVLQVSSVWANIVLHNVAIYTITFIRQLSLHKARSVNAHRQSVFVHYCACYFVSLQMCWTYFDDVCCCWV